MRESSRALSIAKKDSRQAAFARMHGANESLSNWPRVTPLLRLDPDNKLWAADLDKCHAGRDFLVTLFALCCQHGGNSHGDNCRVRNNNGVGSTEH